MMAQAVLPAGMAGGQNRLFANAHIAVAEAAGSIWAAI